MRRTEMFAREPVRCRQERSRVLCGRYEDEKEPVVNVHGAPAASNRPLEDWGKLIGDVPSATAILDRFLHHAEIITITGKSYRLKNRAKDKTEDSGDDETCQMVPA